MQSNNNLNQLPDPSTLFNGSFVDLINTAGSPEDLQQMDEQLGVDAYDLLASITSSPDVTGTSQVQTGQIASTGQSGQLASTLQTTSAQPILTMLMPLMSQTVQTSSTTQSIPMVPVTPLPQTVSTTLLAPTFQLASTSQPIPTAQAIPQVLVDQSAQACSQLAEAAFHDIDDMVKGIGREEQLKKPRIMMLSARFSDFVGS